MLIGLCNCHILACEIRNEHSCIQNQHFHWGIYIWKHSGKQLSGSAKQMYSFSLTTLVPYTVEKDNILRRLWDFHITYTKFILWKNLNLWIWFQFFFFFSQLPYFFFLWDFHSHLHIGGGRRSEEVAIALLAHQKYKYLVIYFFYIIVIINTYYLLYMSKFIRKIERYLFLFY